MFHHASQILKNPRIKVVDKGLRLKKNGKKFRLSPDAHYIGYTTCRSLIGMCIAHRVGIL